MGELTGLPDEDLRGFFAQGMLLNVMAAIDAGALDEAWVRACVARPRAVLRLREALLTSHTADPDPDIERRPSCPSKVVISH